MIIYHTKHGDVLIDDEDQILVDSISWYVNNFRGYNRVRITRGKGKSLSALILKTDSFVDHINGNSLDNRKLNLRPVTQRQNRFNSKIRSDNTSGFKGVTYREGKGYYAQVKFEGKKKIKGYFKTPKEAAFHYNELAIRYHGEFARINKI